MPEQESRKLFYTVADKLAEEKKQMEALLAQGSQFSTEKGTNTNPGSREILPPGEAEKAGMELLSGVLGNLFNSAKSGLQGVLGERNEEFQKYNEAKDAYWDDSLIKKTHPSKLNLKHPGNRPLEGPLDKHGHYESFELDWPDWLKKATDGVQDIAKKYGVNAASRALQNKL